MPYRIIQEPPGRRRRRRRRRWPAVLALIVAAVAAWLLIAPRAGEHTTGLPKAKAELPPVTALQDSGTAPLAGGGTAPSPLAVEIDGPDLVSARFKHPPRSGLLFDIDTGKVLWRHDPTRVLPIASLTKMMTALLVADRIPRRGRVKVTKQALAYQGSGVGRLPKGKSLPVNTMLHGLLLPSGNDAAIALAQRAARGSVARFVGLMNERARAMGLVCTRFSSPSGFADRGNHSCATDLAALARAVLRERRLAKIVKRRQAVLPFPIKGGKVWLYNNNPLLRMGYRGTTGIKTGYTDAAGHCLVASVRRGSVRLGVVLLHSPDTGTQARKLLDRGFAAMRAR
jgi:D-alanyl-D-alanine carboxypeptidase (penicillin-binding protein 5/6)